MDWSLDSYRNIDNNPQRSLWITETAVVSGFELNSNKVGQRPNNPWKCCVQSSASPEIIIQLEHIFWFRMNGQSLWWLDELQIHLSAMKLLKLVLIVELSTLSFDNGDRRSLVASGFSKNVSIAPVLFKSIRCNFSEEFVLANFSCFAKSYSRTFSTMNTKICFKKPMNDMVVRCTMKIFQQNLRMTFMTFIFSDELSTVLPVRAHFSWCYSRDNRCLSYVGRKNAK